MLESISFKGFRKYKDFSLDGFSRVNFILGENNVGKTTILEGIYAWACGQNIVPFMSIPLARGRYSTNQQPYWIMEEILTIANNRYELPMHMEFSGKVDNEEITFEHNIYPSDLLAEYDSTYKKFSENSMPSSNGILAKEQQIVTGLPGIIQTYQPTLVAKWEIKHKEDIVQTDIMAPLAMTSTRKPYKLAKYIDLLTHTATVENVQMYGTLKREALLEEVTEKIQEIYPEIAGFDMIPYPDGSQAPVSVLKKDGTILPMYAFGDGVQRWFYIIGALTLHKGSIICIDEIDTGFHPKAQGEFCKNLTKYAKDNNVQLFISTHNKEFIDNFLDSVDENYNELMIYTLKDQNGSIKTRRLDTVQAKNARDNYGAEFR